MGFMLCLYVLIPAVPDYHVNASNTAGTRVIVIQDAAGKRYWYFKFNQGTFKIPL